MASSTYLINEGFKNVFKNKKSSLASLITMICAMFIFGVVFAIGENANSVVEQVSSSQGMQVFMLADATDEQINTLESEIWAIGTDKIATVTFVSKQEALESMKSSFEDADWIFEGYEGENNIFPVSFIVTLTDLSYSKEVETQIAKLDNIDKIRSSNETIDTLIKIAHGVRLAVIVIFILLLIMAVTIIANTIKLTVHSRRKEISIMKYVGATNGFIRTPFMIEGIVIGLLSGILSIILVGGGYNFLAGKVMTSETIRTIGVNILSFKDLSGQIILVYLVLGVGIGILGSTISMRKYLEV